MRLGARLNSRRAASSMFARGEKYEKKWRRQLVMRAMWLESSSEQANVRREAGVTSSGGGGEAAIMRQ